MIRNRDVALDIFLAASASGKTAASKSSERMR